MGKRAEKPDNNEQPRVRQRAVQRSGQESQAAAGGSTEHKLPVVWSPKLDAGGGIEDEFFDADAAPSPPDDEAAYGEAAKEEPSATRRSRGATALMAFCAARGNDRNRRGRRLVRRIVDRRPASGGWCRTRRRAPNTADANSILRALKSQVAELTAMKSNLDGSTRNANTQFAAIAERLDRVERAATNPAAQARPHRRRRRPAQQGQRCARDHGLDATGAIGRPRRRPSRRSSTGSSKTGSCRTCMATVRWSKAATAACSKSAPAAFCPASAGSKRSSGRTANGSSSPRAGVITSGR